ncbi:universal stress protein [Sinorhizobium garamanticum]|uniref:Universal stress protein n=1 Tax=Sinorhizobium garamanticum TaxID=680247 RepID=A0ABY8DGK8_9HYPH|nr:universal stress protein [Sinorhizobium garamanticum]WEX90014.1 universal stress protein [Sinorhizobium garamanticum]
MTYKTVLLAVGVPQFQSDLRAVADLCATGNMHLSVLPIKIDTLPPMKDFAANLGPWGYDRTSEIEELAEVVKRAREMLSGLGISFDVVGRYAESMWLEHEVGERAWYADITLIGPSLKSDERLRRGVIEGALFHSARPILLASNLQSVTLQPRRILLAWNSSVESARAAREALDMMRNAEGVNVVMVEPKAASATIGEETGDCVASYLARHGVTVTIDRLPGGGRTIAEVLNQHALETGAELMVMGAYGHSRVRERVFGGVTKAMIDAPVVPVMMIR